MSATDITRVLVCGSRTFPEDDPIIECLLEGIDEMHRVGGTRPTVIEGGARGADRAAADWCRGFEFAYPHEQYPAEWEQHGKAAGGIRNRQMLEEGKPDVVIAFVDKPLEQSRGTAHMVGLAAKAGLPVYVVHRISAGKDAADGR